MTEYGLAVEVNTMAPLCPFPYVGSGCGKPLSQLQPSYGVWRFIFLLIGGLAFLVSAWRYPAVLRCGTAHQHYTFSLLLVASTLLVLCGIDPQAYGAIYPLLAFKVMEAMLLSIVWTISICICFLWLLLLESSFGSGVVLGIKVILGTQTIALWLCNMVQAVLIGLDPDASARGAVLSCTAIAIGAQVVSALSLVLLGYILHISLKISFPRSASLASNDTHQDEYVLNQSSVGSSFQDLSMSSHTGSSVRSLGTLNSVKAGSGSMRSRLTPAADGRSFQNRGSMWKLRTFIDPGQEAGIVRPEGQPSGPCTTLSSCVGRMSKVKQVVIFVTGGFSVAIAAELCVLLRAVKGYPSPWLQSLRCEDQLSPDDGSSCEPVSDVRNCVLAATSLILWLNLWVFWKVPAQRREGESANLPKDLLLVDTAGRLLGQESSLRDVEALMPEECEGDRMSESTALTPLGGAKQGELH